MHERSVIRVTLAVIAVGAVAGGARAARADLTVAALLLLVTVLAVGTLGFASGLAAAVVGFLSLNWFFTEPTGSFKIHRTDDVVALAVFAASAALVGWTVQRLSSLRRTALQREAEAKVRLDLTNRLLTGADVDDALHGAADALAELFAFEACTLTAGEPLSAADEPDRANVRVDGPGVHAARPRAAAAHGGRPRAARSARRRARGRRRPAPPPGGGARSPPRRRGRAPARRVPVGGQPQPAHAVDRGEGGGRHAARVVVAHRARGTARAPRDDLRRGRAAGAPGAQHARAEPDPRRRARDRARARRHRRSRAARRAPAASDRARAPGPPRRRRRPAARLARRHDGRADPAQPARERAAIRTSRLGDPGRRAPRADGDDEIELRVADHGPGVPAEARDRIFEEFQSAETRPDRSGTGLGLAIVRALVVAHGGSVRYEDTPGGGATFVCTFPREARAA